MDLKLTYELTFQDVVDILRLVDAGCFAELDVDLPGLRLHVAARRGAAPADHAAELPVAAGAFTDPGAAASRTSPALPAAADPPRSGRVPAPDAPSAGEGGGPVPEHAGCVPVRAPLAGVFYRAPAPGAPPFVDVGGPVRQGDRLGLIEVMKLFTPVVAPCSGTLSEIRVIDQETVHSEQVLALIEPAGH